MIGSSLRASFSAQSLLCAMKDARSASAMPGSRLLLSLDSSTTRPATFT